MCLGDTSPEMSVENYPQSRWAASEEAPRLSFHLLLVARDGAFSAGGRPGPAAGFLTVMGV